MKKTTRAHPLSHSHSGGEFYFGTSGEFCIGSDKAERMIKLIVRGRRNSQFFKSENGAEVSDIITSVLATCHEANIDALAYLIAVQANQLSVRAAPQNWMPWNYPGGQ